MKLKLIFFYFTVFISGLTSLAVELAASRLLGNVFGSSNLVWASIIGLILIYLTIGYYIGGKWADHSPNPATFYTILCWAALAVGVIPVISRPVLRFSANAFDKLDMVVLFGSFLAVLVLFVVPVILLGTASPFAIKLLLKDSRSTGRTAGRISAISTLGSFIGTFLPVLVLIPIIGTYRTFIAISALLMAVALAGLWLNCGWRKAAVFAWMPVVLVLITLFGLPGSDRNPEGLIYETESQYNYIQVLERDGFRFLRLNEGQGVHSIYHPDVTNFYGPWEQFLVAPFFNPAPYVPAQVQRIAIVGLAAGTTARASSLVYGDIPIDGFEIDPQIIEVGQDYFAMTEAGLNAIPQDGRWGLAHSPYLYQLISVDAYRPPYIPWHLTTREFFEIVQQHLTPDGVVAINVGRAPNDRRLIDALGSTLASVFPSVFVMDIPETFNSIIFATNQPTTADNLVRNYAILVQNEATPPLLLETMEVTIANLALPFNQVAVMTDDRAPIEWLTNGLVINTLLSGEIEDLK